MILRPQPGGNELVFSKSITFERGFRDAGRIAMLKGS
jgi:hypothetical protein